MSMTTTRQRFFQSLAAQDFSYSHQEITKTQEIPAGYRCDQYQIHLGYGQRVFQGAVVALKKWKAHQVGWIQAVPLDAPIQPKSNVVIAIGIFGVQRCGPPVTMSPLSCSVCTRFLGHQIGFMPLSNQSLEPCSFWLHMLT